MKWRMSLLIVLVGGMLTATSHAEEYLRDLWSKVHSPAEMAKATDKQCLSCHQDILTDKPLASSFSGVSAKTAIAWYQNFDTYTGEQDSFHRRHMVTPFAKSVMNLTCSTCHVGHDSREEASVPMQPTGTKPLATTWRKQVNPETTCLKCHGAFPAANMGLEGSWHELRADLENDEQPNGCLTCHAEQFRTVRHQVTYLNAAEIEKQAAKSSDSCFGCHGGRAWYRISYPYPRHPWPGMPDDVPDWAKDRPTQSEARFLLPPVKPATQKNQKKEVRR